MERFDALMTVCFGTADADRFDRCFASIHRMALQESGIPKGVLTVTSSHIRERLAEQGVVLSSPGQALDALRLQSRRRVLVLALFISEGNEWAALRALCRVRKGDFEQLTLIPPLLRDRYPSTAQALNHLIPPQEKTVTVLLGHGGALGENDSYLALLSRLHALGRKDFSLTMLHGSPTPLETVASLRKQGCTRVRLVYLLFCAGHHAQEAFSPGGIVACLKKVGIDTEISPLELGQEESFQRLFLSPFKNLKEHT